MRRVSLPLYLAWRDIRRGNKGTLVLTILIIAMSFVLMVFMPSLTSGIIGAYNQQVVDYQYADLIVEPQDDEQTLSNTSAMLKKIRRIPGVMAVASQTHVSSTLTSDKKTLSRGITAIIPSDEREVTLTSSKIIEGKYLSDGDTNTILLGSILAGHEDEKKDKLESLGGIHTGDSIMVTFQNGVVREMVVGGIFETGSIQADSEAFITRKEMEQVFGSSDRSSRIIIRSYTGSDRNALKNRLLEFGVKDKVKTVTEKGEGIIGDAVKSFSLLSSIMVVFSLIIASIVIFIIVYINTINQRRQIGILKAIGIPENEIIKNYLAQVGFIFCAGSVAGLCLFEIICRYFQAFPLQFPAGMVYPISDPAILVPSLAMLGIVSLVAGFIPARQATREEILDLVNG